MTLDIVMEYHVKITAKATPKLNFTQSNKEVHQVLHSFTATVPTLTKLAQTSRQN